MEQSFKNHPYASLVRESIQNSLDAVLDKSEPVIVKFSFMEMQGFIPQGLSPAIPVKEEF